jgi:glyoxylase-like metal-dependent hydrolase (beta-lactamase superfamily II)
VQIHAIQTGTVAIKERQRAGKGPGPARALITMASRPWTEPLPILAWLIEHPDGLILVDTGDTARTGEPGYFPRWNPYYKLATRIEVAADEEVGPRLEALGFAPSDVKTVVLTHMHTDHAGGLHHFPHSEVLVSKTEYDLATGRTGKILGYLPHRWPEWFRPNTVEIAGDAFGPFDHSLEIADGVTVIPTPGHTPGHLSVAVETDEGVVLLAGDTSYTEQFMRDGIADGVTDKPAVARDTLARIRALAPRLYLPTHDPESVGRKDSLTARQ